MKLWTVESNALTREAFTYNNKTIRLSNYFVKTWALKTTLFNI